MKSIAKTISEYNKVQTTDENRTCAVLAKEIHTSLPEALSKIWHGAPVWFLDGNPVAGYSKQRAGIRLMFWSGADFEEEDLSVRGGKFKDASIFYTSVEQINTKDLKRWLKKSRDIQWDYKNIVKRKGKLLIKLNPNKKLKDGAQCKVVGGTHEGKSGVVRDIKTSSTGHVTITVLQANGERFKTLAKNIELT